MDIIQTIGIVYLYRNVFLLSTEIISKNEMCFYRKNLFLSVVL